MPRRVRALFLNAFGRPHVGILQDLLARYRAGECPTESELESRALDIMTAAGMSPPDKQVPILVRGRVARVDFLFSEQRIVIEVDGYEHHSDPIAFERDRARRNALTASGFKVLQWTWRAVCDQPEVLCEELRQTFLQRAHLMTPNVLNAARLAVNADQATKTALRLLKARARTRQEVETALEARGCERDVRAAVLEKLAGWGYLDDARFARQRATALLREGQGPNGVLRRLEGHGLDEIAARAALADAEAELGGTTEERARALLARRRATGAKAARLLASRGYPENVIEALRLDPSPEDE